MISKWMLAQKFATTRLWVSQGQGIEPSLFFEQQLSFCCIIVKPLSLTCYFGSCDPFLSTSPLCKDNAELPLFSSECSLTYASFLLFENLSLFEISIRQKSLPCTRKGTNRVYHAEFGSMVPVYPFHLYLHMYTSQFINDLKVKTKRTLFELSITAEFRYSFEVPALDPELYFPLNLIHTLLQVFATLLSG